MKKKSKIKTIVIVGFLTWLFFTLRNTIIIDPKDFKQVLDEQ